MIECKKCNCRLRNIGKTKGIMKFHLAENTEDKLPMMRIQQLGHNISDLSITILEQEERKGQMYRKETEKYFFRKFNTFYRGLNCQP